MSAENSRSNLDKMSPTSDIQAQVAMPADSLDRILDRWNGIVIEPGTILDCVHQLRKSPAVQWADLGFLIA